MPEADLRGILQLDFDGTLAEGDVSTGILARYVSPEWSERVSAASRALAVDPDSPALVDTMVAGFAHLTGNRDEYLRFALEHHLARDGLPELIAAAERRGLECHVVSNGFEFYIREYLRRAGVESSVSVHTGSEAQDGSLRYLGPEDEPVRGGFKARWTAHFLSRCPLLVYVGDGTSDVAAAQQASIVFARDSLLTGMLEGFAGTLQPFETLHDVALGLEGLLG